MIKAKVLHESNTTTTCIIVCQKLHAFNQSYPYLWKYSHPICETVSPNLKKTNSPIPSRLHLWKSSQHMCKTFRANHKNANFYQGCSHLGKYLHPWCENVRLNRENASTNPDSTDKIHTRGVKPTNPTKKSQISTPEQFPPGKRIHAPGMKRQTQSWKSRLQSRNVHTSKHFHTPVVHSSVSCIWSSPRQTHLWTNLQPCCEPIWTSQHHNLWHDRCAHPMCST